jgi:hypothetical protein
MNIRPPRRRLLQRDVELWRSASALVTLRELAVAGAKVYATVDFHRGDDIDEEEWVSLTRREFNVPIYEQFGNVVGSGLRIRCIGAGREMRFSHASTAGGAEHLGVSVAFVRQARDCSIFVGWERLGMPDTTIDVPGGPMWA